MVSQGQPSEMGGRSAGSLYPQNLKFKNCLHFATVAN
jgi:hypothetical protein